MKLPCPIEDFDWLFEAEIFIVLEMAIHASSQNGVELISVVMMLRP